MLARTPIFAVAALVAFAGTAYALGADASYSFPEQASGGRSVLVEDAYLPDGGFLAIHDATLLEGNVIGSVIGVSAYLEAGNTSSSVRVQLTRDLPAGNATLIAMPHKDTDGDRIYGFVASGGTVDGPYMGGPQALAGLTGDIAAFNGIVATPVVVNQTAAVSAADQTSSGRSVLIDRVELSSPGFVAVHDSTLLDANGGIADALGSVVGVSPLLAAGIHENVLVAFDFNASRANVTGLVVPMAHKDSNGNGAYDFVSSKGTDDPPFTGQPGTPLTAVVALTTLTFADAADTTYAAKSTGGRLVVVEEAFLPQGGFLAVHDATLVENADALGSVRGVSEKLAPGIHRDVAVELDFDGKDALNASQTIYVMPHKDTNDNGAYEFVSSAGADDGPYTGGPDALAGLEGDLAAFNTVSTVGANATLGALVSGSAEQRSDGRTIVVDLVDLSVPGFLAVHDQTLLADPAANVLTSVIGVSEALPAGLSRNVTVTLGGIANSTKGELNFSQTLILMPHKDSNGNGVYDFVASAGADDPPFTTPEAAGNTVSALGLHIVVALADATVAMPGASGSGPTMPTAPATPASPTAPPTPTGATPTSGAPTPTGPATTPATQPTTPAVDESTGDNAVPGFGLVALVAALATVALVLRRRRG